MDRNDQPRVEVIAVSPVLKVALDIATAQQRDIMDVLAALEPFCYRADDGLKYLRPSITADDWAAAGLAVFDPEP